MSHYIQSYYPDIEGPFNVSYVVSGLGCLLKFLQIESSHGYQFSQISYDELFELDEEKLLRKKVNLLAAVKMIKNLKKIKKQEIALIKMRIQSSQCVPVEDHLRKLANILPSKNSPIVGRVSYLFIEVLHCLKPYLWTSVTFNECKQQFIKLCLRAEHSMCFEISQVLQVNKLRRAVQDMDINQTIFPYLKHRGY